MGRGSGANASALVSSPGVTDPVNPCGGAATLGAPSAEVTLAETPELLHGRGQSARFGQLGTPSCRIWEFWPVSLNRES